MTSVARGGPSKAPAVSSPVVSRLPRLSFRVWLGAIAALGLVVRVVYVVTSKANGAPEGDAVYFYGQARNVADGHGFLDPILFQVFHVRLQAAHHPPLYVVYLAAWSKLVGTEPEALRLATTLCALGTVVVVGLVGRRLAGERAGLLAALAAAIYPNLWANDALLLSETLYALTIALVLLCAYRLWDDPRPREAALLGAALGVATLTRAEALFLFVILAVPLVWLCKGVDRVARAALVAVVLAVGGLVLAPWVVHNLSRFNQPVYLSYGLSGVLTQANCDETYEGPWLGYWRPECSFTADLGPSAQACRSQPLDCAQYYSTRFGDESDAAAIGQREGLDYIFEHKGRVPVVVAARVGRMWGLFRPGQQVQIDAVAEGRGPWVARAGLVTFYEFAAVGAVGLWMLRRRRVPILPLVSMAVLVTVVAASAIPVTRYRTPLEVALAVLAGVVADQCVTWWARGRTGRQVASARPAGRDPDEAVPDAPPPAEPARA